MADRSALSRKNSDPYSRSEASIAVSPPSDWDEGKSSTNSPPAVRSASATPSSLARLFSTTAPVGPTSSPAIDSVPQIDRPSGAATLRVKKQSMPPWEIRDSVLIINEIDYDNTHIKELLDSRPDIHSVLVQPEYVMSPMVDLLKQFASISTIKTLKFDFYANALEGTIYFLNFNTECNTALSSLLESNTSLTRLDFSNQDISSDLVDAIALGLKHQTSLQVLDVTGVCRTLDSNSIHFKGKLGRGIAAIISQNGGLSSILASRQSMDGEDAILIAGALSKNTTLKTLVLDKNNITIEGSRSIFNAITENKQSALIKLDLSGCEIDISVAQSIAECLKANATLKNVLIGTVPDTTSLKIILEGVLDNKTLTTLHYFPLANPDQEYSAVCQQLAVALGNRATLATPQSSLLPNSSNGTSTNYKGSSGMELS